MFQNTNKIYLVFGTLIYAVVGVLFSVDLKPLYVLNYFTILSFALVITYLIKQPESYFTKKRIVFVIFCYSSFFMLCYNTISYFYTDNFYVFSEGDALLYHEEAEVMSRMSFFEGISYYLSRHLTEDLGIVIILSSLYKIVVSKILLSVFYLCIALITGVSMFNVSKRFMSIKFAGLCAISYCLSSYTIWFHSSGLKESLMVMLIIFFYSNYYSFIDHKRIFNLLGLIFMPLLLLLFRPVLSIFCLTSIVLGIVLRRKLTIPQGLFLFVVICIGIYFLDPLLSSTDKFLLGGTTSMLEIKEVEGLVKGSISFTYLVNILSSTFGPFPTLLSPKVHLTFFVPGLIFKILISVAFWFGIVYVFKNNFYKAYPIILFTLMEMGSLTYILEALELRKSLPHFPLIYIIAFMFFYQYDRNVFTSFKNYKRYRKIFNVTTFTLCVLMVYWNFR